MLKRDEVKHGDIIIWKNLPKDICLGNIWGDFPPKGRAKIVNDTDPRGVVAVRVHENGSHYPYHFCIENRYLKYFNKEVPDNDATVLFIDENGISRGSLEDLFRLV